MKETLAQKETRLTETYSELQDFHNTDNDSSITKTDSSTSNRNSLKMMDLDECISSAKYNYQTNKVRRSTNLFSYTTKTPLEVEK